MDGGSVSNVLLGREMAEGHERKCWDCGNVATHESSITPGVLCKQCGSQDTRRVKAKTKHRHSQFYSKLADLLEEYDVDLVATESSESWGQHHGLINVQFNRDGYRSDELKSLSSDEAREMAGVVDHEHSSA